MGPSGVRAEDAAGVRWIRFDRPEALNALRRADVVEARALVEEACRSLDRLTRHSRTALAAQKRLFETWQNAGLEESIRASVDEFANVFEEEETRAAIRRYAGGLRRKRS
jgi:enoyl-CoA hydratase/carnithine racemase